LSISHPTIFHPRQSARRARHCAQICNRRIPANLRTTTLGDELRLATNGRSRVYGISLKDRAVLLPTGQSANGAFWIDTSSGQFTTSTYYMEHLPEWARTFNTSGRIAEAIREAQVEGTMQFYDLVGRMPASTSHQPPSAAS
jgi:hypothetical protein